MLTPEAAVPFAEVTGMANIWPVDPAERQGGDWRAGYPWLLGAPLVVLRALRGATGGASEWRPPLAWTKGALGKFLRFAQGHNPWASCWSAANRNAALCDYRIVPQLHRFSSDIIVNSVRCEDAVSTAPDLF
ncbi:hypothetical protein EMIHUDRAFT_257537 [Emiliania huxleyi CCMP1516]|uniref:Uncharacterized protein n=2 Tax=Emiliania huxleyi TaxID=2903 RepID=A0A0D3IID6_EMIH1|nr:hypothetical protein EMIHUDRAFT_257537 [Emiliania huxleyi CCMP1516]EOD11021.1 hypothetical protein EMIHUDRAFT_257537 [Emiliania huxleyi CCMP1516]|eukprot:XP_005763450.1 hypothetical protein EMIHUDRAFT_257537 [Emiliania huxleyi CCMP1516]